jgi:glycerol-3-phosphate dehydrogenase
MLVERSDPASATSSASSKLIHGGLRYLEHYEFRLVHEGLSEREVLLAAAHAFEGHWSMRFLFARYPGVVTMECPKRILGSQSKHTDLSSTSEELTAPWIMRLTVASSRCGELPDRTRHSIAVPIGFHGVNLVVVGCRGLQPVQTHSENRIRMGGV